MVVRAMARVTSAERVSVDEQIRRTAIGPAVRQGEDREREAYLRSGNAIVGVAVSALLWLMLALFLFLWFAN